MSQIRSNVLEIAPLAPAASHEFFQMKLALHADAWDVAEDLQNGVKEIVVIDTRATEYYQRGHIPGAISFPHRTMNEASTAHLDQSKTYVTYCDGIGCNGSTKGAHKLAALGFQVKEMLGGLDFWLRDGHPVAQGNAPGSLVGGMLVECAC